MTLKKLYRELSNIFWNEIKGLFSIRIEAFFCIPPLPFFNLTPSVRTDTAMKVIYLLAVVILFNSCTGKNTYSEKEVDYELDHEKMIPGFQAIIDSANLEGGILIYDFQGDEYFSNNFEWARNGKLPASTFKIVNSIIALETQVVENDSTLFKWNGEPRYLPSWEQDLVFRDAFHFSCVPCYQEVARNIGAKKMNEYINQLDYGLMVFDSMNIDMFWLEGKSQVSQFQQIDFLERFHQSELPISERTESIVKSMMVIDENEEYILSGKTGWSVRNGINNGWFVGYIESQNKTYFFATNVEPIAQFDMEFFPEIRKEVTLNAFQQMGIVQ